MAHDPDAPSWLVRLIASFIESEVRSTLLRAWAMVVASAALFALAPYFLRGGSDVWKALVLLAVALVIRAAWDLYELDGALCASVLGATAFGGMALGAFSNLSDRDPSLEWRLVGFIAVAAVLLVVGALRTRRLLRGGR